MFIALAVQMVTTLILLNDVTGVYMTGVNVPRLMAVLGVFLVDMVHIAKRLVLITVLRVPVPTFAPNVKLESMAKLARIIAHSHVQTAVVRKTRVFVHTDVRHIILIQMETAKNARADV